MVKSYAGVVIKEESALDATPRPYTVAEYNVREALYANVQFRQDVPMFDLSHFTGVELRLEPIPSLGETSIRLTTTLVQL